LIERWPAAVAAAAARDGVARTAYQPYPHPK
jgi:hypothetical protein